MPPPDSAADKLLADAPLLLLFDFGADMLCANLTPLLSLFPRSSAPLLQILQRVFLVTKLKKVFAFVELGNFYLKEDEICLISKSNRCKIDKTKASPFPKAAQRPRVSTQGCAQAAGSTPRLCWLRAVQHPRLCAQAAGSTAPKAAGSTAPKAVCKAVKFCRAGCAGGHYP